MRNLPHLIIVLFAASVLAGCGGSRGVDDSDVVVEEQGIVEGTVGGDDTVQATGLDDAGQVGDSAVGESTAADVAARQDLTERVVYFEYDSSLLTEAGAAIVQQHAEYLVGNAGVPVVLEGHADERGTREYNLALAEDRAKAVANIMQARGVDASRIQTVSYGEERPVTLGHDESAWRLNRRVEILYQ